MCQWSRVCEAIGLVALHGAPKSPETRIAAFSTVVMKKTESAGARVCVLVCRVLYLIVGTGTDDRVHAGGRRTWYTQCTELN